MTTENELEMPNIGLMLHFKVVEVWGFTNQKIDLLTSVFLVFISICVTSCV